MRRLDLSMSKVKAIFISHEHGDHIKGLAVLANKFSLPVYITSKTLIGCPDLKRQFVENFTAYEIIKVGELCITAFPKFHDAADPHSFIIQYNGVTVGVFTDIGKSCDHLVKNFRHCDAAFLEANYDEEMLNNGRYPIFLKNRIRGGHGHLSNRQALELFTTHRPPAMSHLLLAHLSKDNNDPLIAKQLFEQHAGSTNIVVASRYEETAVYHIAKKDAPVIRVYVRPTQLQIF
jgi:phosphoribosyl 1,2-cyclic phosphodiesterase